MHSFPERQIYIYSLLVISYWVTLFTSFSTNPLVPTISQFMISFFFYLLYKYVYTYAYTHNLLIPFNVEHV